MEMLASKERRRRRGPLWTLWKANLRIQLFHGVFVPVLDCTGRHCWHPLELEFGHGIFVLYSIVD